MSEATRVLQVLDFINNNSGVSSVVMNYYFHMNPQMVKCDFLLFEKPEEEWEKKLTSRGAKIYVTGQPSGKNILKYRKRVNEFLAQHGNEYDVIHVHIPNVAFLVLCGAKKNGIQTRIIHSHNARGADGLCKKIRNFVLNKWGLCYANKYFACGRLAGEYLFGKNGNFTIVPNAIELERFHFSEESRAKIRQNLGIKNEFLIGHVGRFEEQKNHVGLLAIFKKVCENNKDCILLLIGDGKLKADIEELIKVNKLEDRVILTGVVDNVPEYISAMDLFVLPSLYEGLPVVCVEAQCAGVPCLISENVTQEVRISSQIEFINCKDLEKWQKTIEQYMSKGKTERDCKLGEEYNIWIQAQKLETLYRSNTIYK